MKAPTGCLRVSLPPRVHDEHLRLPDRRVGATGMTTTDGGASRPLLRASGMSQIDSQLRSIRSSPTATVHRALRPECRQPTVSASHPDRCRGIDPSPPPLKKARPLQRINGALEPEANDQPQIPYYYPRP